MAVSNRREDVLVTYSLGSCIAVVLYDKAACVGGMVHYMLPESAMDPEKARTNPAMFADTGVPALFRAAYALGAQKRSLRVTVAGGARILDDAGLFNIGKRNYLTLRNLFYRNNVLTAAEHVGGSDNRTVRLEMATGRVFLKTPDEGEREL